MIRCVGHRGGAGLAPENTLAAFRAGIAAGADAVECDVHRTVDGHLVLMHDADISRTTNGRGRVGRMTFAELRRLNCAARFGDGTFEPQEIPTLAELLTLAQGQCAIQIEIKVPEGIAYDGIEAGVVAALRDHDIVGSAQIICFDAATLARTRAMEPGVSLGYLASRSSSSPEVRRSPVRLSERAQACGATFLGLDHEFLAAGHLVAAGKRDLGVAVWTVNDRAEMEQMARMGVGSITSDRPDLLRSVLAELDR